MNSKIHRVIYVSSASEALTKEELDSILATSRKNNRQKDITGMLIYSSGNILQILEGEKTHLDSLYNVILKDTRHYGCIKLQDKETDNRMFTEWSMGFKDVSSKESEKLEGYFDIRDKNVMNVINLNNTVKVIIDVFLENNR